MNDPAGKKILNTHIYKLGLSVLTHYAYNVCECVYIHICIYTHIHMCGLFCFFLNHLLLFPEKKTYLAHGLNDRYFRYFKSKLKHEAEINSNNKADMIIL